MVKAKRISAYNSFLSIEQSLLVANLEIVVVYLCRIAAVQQLKFNYKLPSIALGELDRHIIRICIIAEIIKRQYGNAFSTDDHANICVCNSFIIILGIYAEIITVFNSGFDFFIKPKILRQRQGSRKLIASDKVVAQSTFNIFSARVRAVGRNRKLHTADI